MKNEKNIVKGFDDYVRYVDDKNSFPNYLLYYLRAFGINIYTWLEDGKTKIKYIYNGEELNVKVTNNFITFYSSNDSYVAKIDRKTNMILFKDGSKTASVEEMDYCTTGHHDEQVTYYAQNNHYYANGKETHICEIDQYGGLCYAKVGRVHRIYVYNDVLGNITISYRYLGIDDRLVIKVGENHETARSYIMALRDEIDDKKISKEDLDVIDVMFNDPRILNLVTKLMDQMAPNIETAYENKVMEIKSVYQDKIDKIVEEKNKVINELDDYKRSYLEIHNSWQKKK